MNFDKLKEQLIGLAKTIGAGFFRAQLIFFALGVIVSSVGFFATGFFDFREANHKLISDQYEKTVSARKTFSQKIDALNSIFEGVDNIEAVTDIRYRTVAQDYIEDIEAITALLPDARSKKDEYVDAIASLNKFYTVVDAPDKGTEEWITFFGNFRIVYDRFLNSEDAYFNTLAASLKDYQRHIFDT